MSQQSFKLGGSNNSLQRRPPTLEWTREQVLRLVDLYHGQPALWDSSDTKFKDRQAKRWALMTIASQLSLPPIDVEKKIHCLRTQFNREYLKMKTSARKPTWFAYQPLSFVLRNKLDVPFDITQWHPAGLNIKEELTDEYDGDDIDMRLIVDESPVVRDGDIVHTTDNSNCTSSDNVNEDNNSVSSANDLKTSSAVEVILHEPSDDEQQTPTPRVRPSQLHKKFIQPSMRVHSSLSSMMYNETDGNRCHMNNSVVLPPPQHDELTVFGKLLTDELLKVNDYFTLQSAKYEISKVIFKATTGIYDKDSIEHEKLEQINWKVTKCIRGVEARSADDSRMSSLSELQTYAAVVMNELRAVTDSYALQVAKFYINQVLFHATTAGLRQTSSTNVTSSPKKPNSRSSSPFNDESKRKS